MSSEVSSCSIHLQCPLNVLSAPVVLNQLWFLKLAVGSPASGHMRLFPSIKVLPLSKSWINATFSIRTSHMPPVGINLFSASCCPTIFDLYYFYYSTGNDLFSITVILHGVGDTSVFSATRMSLWAGTMVHSSLYLSPRSQDSVLLKAGAERVFAIFIARWERWKPELGVNWVFSLLFPSSWDTIRFRSPPEDRMPTRQLGKQRRNTLYHATRGRGWANNGWPGRARRSGAGSGPAGPPPLIWARGVFSTAVLPLVTDSGLPDWTPIHPRRWSLPP